jgi:hypothetical protein
MGDPVRMPDGVMDYLERGTTPVAAAEAETQAAAGDPETYERALERRRTRTSSPVRQYGRPIMTMLAEALEADSQANPDTTTRGTPR